MPVCPLIRYLRRRPSASSLLLTICSSVGLHGMNITSCLTLHQLSAPCCGHHAASRMELVLFRHGLLQLHCGFLSTAYNSQPHLCSPCNGCQQQVGPTHPHVKWVSCSPVWLRRCPAIESAGIKQASEPRYGSINRLCNTIHCWQWLFCMACCRWHLLSHSSPAM